MVIGTLFSWRVMVRSSWEICPPGVGIGLSATAAGGKEMPPLSSPEYVAVTRKRRSGTVEPLTHATCRPRSSVVEVTDAGADGVPMRAVTLRAGPQPWATLAGCSGSGPQRRACSVPEPPSRTGTSTSESPMPAPTALVGSPVCCPAGRVS